MCKNFLAAKLSLGLLASIPGSLLANLVSNGSFESFTEGRLNDWMVGRSLTVSQTEPLKSERGVTILIDEDADSAMQHALKFKSVGGESDYGQIVSQPFPMIPGFEYEMSVSYRAEGLIPENLDRSHYSALNVDLYMEREANPRRVGFGRVKTSNNSVGWVSLSQFFPKRVTSIRVPAGVEWGVVRAQLVNKCPSPATVWVDSIEVLPLDITVPNGGFEIAAPDAEAVPDFWVPYGPAKTGWSAEKSHNGHRSISVSDAGDGLFSGWSAVVPVRPDRSYSFTGYVLGGDLNPDGSIGGGALALEFLDKDRQPIGKQQISSAVPAHTDWTQVRTTSVTPPRGAVLVRLVAGLNFCRGTAWFDDLALIAETVQPNDIELLVRAAPQPSSQVNYAPNLIKNGTLEELTSDNRPVGWTYHGKSTPDWTDKEIKAYYEIGRPDFSIGRGQGELSQTTAYAGRNALLNISIAPPLSSGSQWHAYGPVDGYWLSDPAPCEAGQLYMASAWLRMGRPAGIGSSMWTGPLEIYFYDAAGRQLKLGNAVRSGIGELLAGEWSYFGTQASRAPKGAASLKLRFGHEFHATKGGQGRTYADNLAVWKIPSGLDLPDPKEVENNADAYHAWYRTVTESVKPPYASAPVSAAPYESVWGLVRNTTPGNLFFDADAPATIDFDLINLLGEDRTVLVKTTRYDAWGNIDAEVLDTQPYALNGASTIQVHISMPPTKKYGSWYLDSEILEHDVTVGRVASRYAVLPPLNQAKAPNNPVFAVTVLAPVNGDDGRPYEKELGELLDTAGFGTAWVHLIYSPSETAIMQSLPEVLRRIDWYRSHGMNSVVRLQPVSTGAKMPDLDYATFEAAGRVIGRELNGRVSALGNWGIEQANSASPFRGGGTSRWTDNAYDTIMAAQYDGIKATAPDLTVLTGNIATDFDAKTVRRLYQSPGNGKFDGTVNNAYMGALGVLSTGIKEFDKQGDSHKTIWWEENADQRSPYDGPARRYGEIEGAKEMVRTWLTMIGKLSPRLKTVTFWGFVRRHEEDIVMVTPTLQPRPQLAAHAIMADMLRQATNPVDQSRDNLSIYTWTRPEGPVITAWSNAGEGTLTLEAASGDLVVTDIFGNAHHEQAKGGVVTVKLSTYPVYLTSSGSFSLSQRLEARLMHDATPAHASVSLVLKNNQPQAVAGEVSWSGGFVPTKPVAFTLNPGASTTMSREVSADLPATVRSTFRADIKTNDGASYVATAAFNMAVAVRVPDGQAGLLLDGTWDAWQSATALKFGIDPDDVVKTNLPPDVTYRGADDVSGTLRFMWDTKNLYLGVEAIDDHHEAVPERAARGFMGDSIEFGIQADGLTAMDSPHSEFELYLPNDGSDRYMASRRFPLPATTITNWQATVKPTGLNGNINYQVAIPWSDISVTKVEAAKVITMALVLNDADRGDRFTGHRKRVRWFSGIDGAKNPTGFGDIVLVNAPGAPANP